MSQEYLIEDLGGLFIFPGLIDTNVHLGGEGVTAVTRAALTGGVTCIATSDYLSGEVYTDVARLAMVSDEKIHEIPSLRNSGIFGFKAVLVPQGPASPVLTRIEEVIENIGNLPLFIHPEYASPKELNQATPYRCIIPEERLETPTNFEIEEKSESESSSESDCEIEPFSYSPYSTPTTTDVGGIRRTSFKIPTNIKPFELFSPEKKRGSLPNVLSFIGNKEEIKQPPSKLKKSRHSMICTIGNNSKPFPIQDIPCMKRGSISKEAYLLHMLSFPESWESAAIEKILSLKPSGKIHFTNLSSNSAVELINEYKEKYPKITCESSLPYLYYSSQDVKPGDTRYKSNPPIREIKNHRLL